MVASSAQQSAPVIVIKPATPQASNNQPGAPLKRADSAEVIKIPEPIIDPITIVVASIGPSARTNPPCCCLSLTLKTSAPGSLHLHFRAANATRARNPPRQAYRHAGILF